MFTRPKPRRELIPFERLTFDAPRLQLRTGLPDGATCDPDTARLYAEALEAGEEFPPLEVVMEPGRARKSQPVYWVFGGFTRGEAYRLHGQIHSVQCNVYDGTFADALFYALSENAKHGAARSHGDKRRAIATLLDNPSLMDRIRAVAPKSGGMHRTIAAACGVGRSMVDVVLRDRDLSVDGLKLIPRKPAPAKKSNEPLSLSNIGQTQTDSSTKLEPEPTPVVVVSPPSPAPSQPSEAPPSAPPAQANATPAPAVASPPEPEPVPEGDGSEEVYVLGESEPEEPLYTVTPPEAHQPDIQTGEVTADMKPSAATGRAKADEIIRLFKEASEKLHEYLRGPHGAMLKRATVRGTEMFRKDIVREKTKFASVDKAVWVHPAVAQLIEAMRKTRPKVVCAGCRGAHGGCRACRGLGFVPDDAELLKRDEQMTFDLGDPFEVL